MRGAKERFGWSRLVVNAVVMGFKRIRLVLRNSVNVVFENELSVANKYVVRYSKTVMMENAGL